MPDTNSVTYAPDFYSRPPKNAMPGLRMEYREISLLTTQMLTTIIFALGIIPAGHRLMSFRLECEDLDSGSSATMDVGILNHYYNEAEATTLTPGFDGDASTSAVLVTAQKIIAANVVPRAGGWASPDATFNLSLTIGVDYTHNRILAFQFAHVPATAHIGKVAFVYALDWD